MTGSPSLQVTVAACPRYAELEDIWRELEGRADGSFFTSWRWIGVWLGMLPSPFSPLLVRAETEGRVVGLGVVVPSRSRRYGVFVTRGLMLHSTGNESIDELTIEYNGFLAERGLESEVTRACLARLFSSPDWDRCVVDGVERPELFDLPVASKMRRVVVKESPCCIVDLSAFTPGGYLGTLDKQARYTVRRTLRDLGEIGPVRLQPAANLREAQEYLARLKALHQAYWQSRGRPGSFASAFFDSFQARLVETSFPDGVHVLRLSAGDVEVGYLYNLVHRGWVYQYLSGFDYARFPGRSPGTTAHALAVEMYAEGGYRLYDFMAGDAPYKRDLGAPLRSLSWIGFRRDTHPSRAEDRLRALWRRWRQSSLRTAAREGLPR